MTENIDQQIALIEKELSSLRRQKLDALLNEIAALEASIGSVGEGAGAVTKAQGRRTKAPAAPAPAPGAGKEKGTRKRRGPKRGPRMSDEEVLGKLRTAVKAAGKQGISARAAALEAGVFYPRALKIMDGNFTKSGRGKWTRYAA